MLSLGYGQILVNWGYTHKNLILALIYQANKTLRHTSDFNFSIMLPMTPCFFFKILFDHVDSAAVVELLVFNCSFISLNNSLLNSALLLERKRLGVPNNHILCLKVPLIITFSCFE